MPAFSAIVSRPSWEDASTSSWWPAWFPNRFVYHASSRIFYIGALAVLLATPDPAKPVRDALRRVLHDPQLDICYWVPASRAYVDSAGRPADPDNPGPGQLAIPITGSDGMTPLAILFAHLSAVRDRPLLDGALSASRMALENARLQADLQAQLTEAKASRARIVEAGLAERRKLERNLHDGAQQHLLGLAAKLSAARVRTHRPGRSRVHGPHQRRAP